MGDYIDALAKDLDRLDDQLKKFKAALKKSPNDAKVLKQKQELEALLAPSSLKKRYEHATKLDYEAMGKRVKDCGLPGW